MVDVDGVDGLSWPDRELLRGVGDRLYGRGGDSENLQLTACRLQFHCPISGEMKDYQLDESLLPVF